jgi:hypothetical protein
MTDVTAPTGTYDSKTEAEGADNPTFVKRWLDELEQANASEKDWRKEAEDAVEVYRGKRSKKHAKFNILHSNVETLTPALYNSTPSPDVRRRFADNDPVAKVVSDLLERTLSFAVDTYDFDSVMKSTIRDGEIAGRGVPRVRYVPTFGQDGMVAYEEVICEYVPWAQFRRGPGRAWSDIPWVAFADYLTRDQLRDINPEIADKIPLNHAADANGNSKRANTEESSIFRRALVWQIWDKDNRRVLSICPDYTDAPVKVVGDPLELTNFFPIPRPYQPVNSTDTLVPIVPYEIYRDLVDELNVITSRISKLVTQLRPRGMYGGTEANDIVAWATAGDGELVPATNAASIIDGVGMDKLIAWFPLDPTVKALAQLVTQRDLVKQTIYEVTGVADILRGQTHASETATAQQIKAQWGSLRIQDRQSEVARVARDLFRLKAEIIASKFSMDTLMQMTGIKLPTQQMKDMAQQAVAQSQQPGGQPLPPVSAEDQKMLQQPSVEEVEKLLRSDVSRAYRIDIESDSTIRGDLSRSQQNMSMFLQGTSQFATAMAPIIAQSPGTAPAIMEIYAAFTRNFKLGKSAEDALDSLTEALKSAPPKDKTDPKVEAEKAQAAAKMQQTQLEMQRDKQKHDLDVAKMEREAQRDQQKADLEDRKLAQEGQRLAMKEREAAIKQMMQPAPPMAQEPGEMYEQPMTEQMA